MTTIANKRPQFYRAIHYPFSDQIISTQGRRSSEHPTNRIGSSLKQCKKLTNSTKDQYIKLRPPGSNGLPYSAKFRCGDSVWKLHGECCLVTIGSNYVAQVSIEYIPELENMSDFEASKKLLLGHLKTDNVLFDREVKETTDAVKTLHELLYDLGNECAVDLSSGKSLLELWKIASKYNYKITADFSDEINLSEFITHKQLKAIIKQYVKKNHKLEVRNLLQRGKHWIQGLVKKNFFEESLKTAIKNHQTIILETCTSTLRQNIACLEPQRCLMLRKSDVKLFSDLECALNESLFKEVLSKIELKFIKRITAIKLDNYQPISLVNNIYFHVCKSMLEIANRVEEELEIGKSLEYANGWNIVFVENGNALTTSSKCLVKQLQVLVNFANYFEPGKITEGKEFPYECKLKLFNSSQLIPKDQFIWLYLVDTTMTDIFRGNTERIEAFSTVLEMFYTFVSSDESRKESQESVRMVAHNTLDFVIQVEQSAVGNNTADTVILRKQISFITPEFHSGNFAFFRYRDILDVFKNYWQRFNEVLPKLKSKLAGQHLKTQVFELKKHLLSIVSQALDKKEHSEEVIKFFRTYNDLTTDMEDMPFEWYVRIQNPANRYTLLHKKLIQKVQNKLVETDNVCYQVQNGQHDQFVECCADDEIPKHYQIEVVKTLLKIIAEIGHKQTWMHGDKLSAKDQLTSTVFLINAVRSSLLYLKDQPDYIDFDKYHEESVKPFSSVVDDSICLGDFIKRVELIKDSFWYIRNQNSIGIDKALQLFKPHNDHMNEELLKSSFERYNNQFMKYMVDYSMLNAAEKVQEIVQDVHNKVKPLHNSEWTSEFKQTLLPEVLAGLGAVWSTQISRDVANSGQHLKPHSIQILSILRLLSVDNRMNGVKKHLAQILTGQGKSVVLGLVAALLALFDHDVVVVCYSDYLAQRDSKDFRGLFRMFFIDSKISYKTFEKMAFDEIDEVQIKGQKYVAKCIGIPYESRYGMHVEAVSNNTVLLIDEVDVFFMEKLYGNTLNVAFHPVLPGLGKVQQLIWTKVQEGNSDVKGQIKAYIDHSNDSDIQKLKTLMKRGGSYKHLETDNSERDHTNQTLFLTHIEQMIECAKYIETLSADDNYIRNYRLDSNGNISKKDDFGVYKSNKYDGYWNTFVYFKLRKKNFIQSINNKNNFGYLNLRVASCSYSKIPENYQLILGVTGTLNEMNAYEKHATRSHYKILQTSSMPSFFGSFNLKFDQLTNFSCHETVTEWRQAIFTRVNAIIDARRSVIAFFDNETEISQFKQEFQSQLDRLNEITINTEANIRDRYIAEAGLSRTVTLATREMGRGVDYKSSLSVEKNGGIHVIQTFFSLDKKEETQIKGRTARKDNAGSYELVVSRPYLVKQKLISSYLAACAINYACLEQSRDMLNDATYHEKAEKLRKSNEVHENSIRLYENL